jgi:hypothetical protein
MIDGADVVAAHQLGQLPEVGAIQVLMRLSSRRSRRQHAQV